VILLARGVVPVGARRAAPATAAPARIRLTPGMARIWWHRGWQLGHGCNTLWPGSAHRAWQLSQRCNTF